MSKMAREIEIFKDYVLILGHRVERPSRYSPSQWMMYWKDLLSSRK